MEHRRMEYILQVASCGSILKAAEKLYITPSALSKYIARTEEELGVPLFDRVGKKFVLTYAGERYLEWIRQIMDTEKNLQKEMQDIAATKCGRIRFGVQSSGIEYIIQEVLPEFYRAYPMVKIELYEDTSRNLKRMLRDNELDFAILPDTEDTASFKRILLTESHPVLLLPKSSPFLQQARIRENFSYPWINIERLKEERFIAPFDTQAAYHAFAEVQDKLGFQLNVVLQAENFGTIAKCVKSEIGMTISEDHIVKAARLENEVGMLSFGSIEKTAKLQICSLNHHYMDQAARSLIRLIMELYQPGASKEGPSVS